MKITSALFAALLPVVATSHAQLVAVDPSYAANPYFIHSDADSIVSYDWASDGNVYYQTSTSNFTFGGLYDYNGSSITQVAAPTADYSGGSVVAIGTSVYYNSSDSSGNEKIFQYGQIGASPAVTLASTAPNFGLYQNQGRLFITGAPNFGTNHIYYTNLNSNGSFAGTPVDLGVDSGSSGPLSFDAAGNLFYAPGYGDTSIYRWSSAAVQAAIADPINHPLSAAGHQWLNYSTLYDSYAGATSMLLDQSGNLLVTLTNFGDPSLLVKFGVGSDGSYDNLHATLFQDTDNLGELRLHQGALYLSSGDAVFAIVPEPSSACLLALGGVLALGAFWRRPRAKADWTA